MPPQARGLLALGASDRGERARRPSSARRRVTGASRNDKVISIGPFTFYRGAGTAASSPAGQRRSAGAPGLRHCVCSATRTAGLMCVRSQLVCFMYAYEDLKGDSWCCGAAQMAQVGERELATRAARTLRGRPPRRRREWAALSVSSASAEPYPAPPELELSSIGPTQSTRLAAYSCDPEHLGHKPLPSCAPPADAGNRQARLKLLPLGRL